jgi:2-amino-4-hydroxy-6-hydroxymethyldihydropteridine diphosphokinase
VEAFVGLGANLGDRLAALRAAVRALDVTDRTAVAATSAVYETEAHVLPGTARQPDHLNAVVAVRTALPPLALLRRLHAVERAAGRDPGAPRWAPRPLDLDLLLWGDAEVRADGLVVPHPALAARRFVLRPLADVAPDRVVPGLGASVSALLAATPDRARVEPTGHALR